MKNIKTQILSVGSYLPEQVIKSDDLLVDMDSERQYNIPYDWMSKTMGIIERRVAPTNANPSDLAIPAAKKAIENANINPDDIDLVIFSGIERDCPEPATAHLIQSSLGLHSTFAFDVANACYGFVDAINIALKFINSNSVKYALIVTGEVPTRVLHTVHEKLKKGIDPETAKKLIGGLSVGDAGGAVILGPSLDGNTGFEVLQSGSESRHSRKCYYKFDENGNFDGQMLMGHMAALMHSKHNKLFNDTLDKLGWSEFDWVLSHQIGLKPFERLREMSGIKSNRMIKTYPYLGNITTATFPVSFEVMANSGKVRLGERIGGFFGGSGVVYGQFGYTF
ncbi:MAG: 3-oxoacyl-ACP synthase III family protein [Arenicella sp.]